MVHTKLCATGFQQITVFHRNQYNFQNMPGFYSMEVYPKGITSLCSFLKARVCEINIMNDSISSILVLVLIDQVIDLSKRVQDCCIVQWFRNLTTEPEVKSLISHCASLKGARLDYPWGPFQLCSIKMMLMRMRT